MKQTLDQRLVSGVSPLYVHENCSSTVLYSMHACTLQVIFCTVGSILILSDLQSVYEKVIKAAKNWLDLGLTLDLDHDTLDNIKDDCHRNKDCLREMLAARLKTGPLTYSEICSGLRAPTVERNDVAEAIEKACTGMNSNCACMMSLTSVPSNSDVVPYSTEITPTSEITPTPTFE